jgi:hypothetical protein
MYHKRTTITFLSELKKKANKPLKYMTNSRVTFSEKTLSF